MKKSVVASLASILTLNVVCLSFVTFAWFTAKNNVDSGTTDIFAVDGTVVENIEIFNILRGEDIAHVEGIRYFDDNPSDEFVLARYSPLEKRCQSLIKVTLSGSFSSIGVEAQITSDDPYYIKPSSSTDADHKLKAEHNPLSNITVFEVFKDDAGTVVTHDTANDRYVMVYDENKSRDTFVNENCDAISTELNLGTLTDVSEFYILIGYNEKSIDTIYSNYLGDPLISGEGVDRLDFDVDFRFHLTDSTGGGA